MIPEHWENYRFGLVEISKGNALRRFRQSIKDEWGCCAYCGTTHDKGVKIHLTIDHVKPKAFGGDSFRTNLVPACHPCNQAKGSSRDWMAWYEEQTFFTTERAARIQTWITPTNQDLFDLWCLSGTKANDSRSNSRTEVHASQDCDREQGHVEGSTYRRIVRVLGGQVQAEANLSCI